MSFSILKQQVKYCLLNKEDQELDKMIENREIKDFSTSNNLTSLKQNNEEFFRLKEQHENKVNAKTMQMLNNSEKLSNMPTRKEVDKNKFNNKKNKSKEKKSTKHQEL